MPVIGGARGGRAFHARHAARDRRRRGAGPRLPRAAAGPADPAGRPAPPRRDADRAAGPAARFAGEARRSWPTSGSASCSSSPATRSTSGCCARTPDGARPLSWLVTAALAGGVVGLLYAARARPGVRPGRHRADDDGAGHAAADPAREPPAGRPARLPPARRRRGRRAAADHRGRPVPRHDQPVRRAHLAGGRRGRRVRPDPAVAVVPRRADPHVHRGGRARDHADRRVRGTVLLLTLLLAVDRAVPSRRGARRVPGRHGAAAVGGQRPAGAGGQAGRARLRLLHPDLLRLLGDVDGPAVDGRRPRCGC